MNRPGLISVIIPAYNAAETITETLISVTTQTYSELEIIVVDDGSIDSTADLVVKFYELDDRIQLIQQANMGVAGARNTGWRASSGDLVAFLDADDLWAPTKLQKQYDCINLQSENTGLVYCFYTRIDESGFVTENWSLPPHNGNILTFLLRENFIGANGSCLLVRRKVLELVGGFNNIFRQVNAEGCDDYLFCCLAAEIRDFACVPEILVGYRERPGSLSSDPIRMLKSRFVASKILFLHFNDQRQFVKEGLFGFTLWLVRKIMLSNQAIQVFPVYANVVRLSPVIALKLLISIPVLIFEILCRMSVRFLRILCSERRYVTAKKKFLFGKMNFE